MGTILVIIKGSSSGFLYHRKDMFIFLPCVVKMDIFLIYTGISYNLEDMCITSLGGAPYTLSLVYNQFPISFMYTCIISYGGAPYTVFYLLQVSRIIGRIRVLSHLVVPPYTVHNQFPITFRYLVNLPGGRSVIKNENLPIRLLKKKIQRYRFFSNTIFKLDFCKIYLFSIFFSYFEVKMLHF